jgi:hypothetical protein
MSQFPCMRDFAAADGTNLIRGNDYDCSRFACERHKSNLVSSLLRVDVNDGTDIAGFKALVMKRSRQDDAVVFAEHRFFLSSPIGFEGSQEWQRRQNLKRQCPKETVGQVEEIAVVRYEEIRMTGMSCSQQEIVVRITAGSESFSEINDRGTHVGSPSSTPSSKQPSVEQKDRAKDI